MLNPQIINQFPFQSGANLPSDHWSYVARAEDKQLLQDIKKIGLCYVCNSRQMGKSSLLLKTQATLQKDDYITLRVDLSDFSDPEITVKEWYTTLLHNISQKLWSKPNRPKLSSWLKEKENISPKQLFFDFIEQLLIPSFSKRNIVIFIDELDYILSPNFPDTDFLSLIRACHEKYYQNDEYRRLSFALFGVIDPSLLANSKTLRPFNTGQIIELGGLPFENAEHLAQGLENTYCDSKKLLETIFEQTGGQPFLTQKVCKFIQIFLSNAPLNQPTYGQEKEWVIDFVQENLIEQWREQDANTSGHFNEIYNSILKRSRNKIETLTTYKSHLNPPYKISDNASKNSIRSLLLAGLIVRKNGSLQIFNPIYRKIFTSEWVEHELKTIRPYSTRMKAWHESNYQDKSQLLRGKDLEETIKWSKQYTLSSEDYEYLDACKKLTKNKQLFRVFSGSLAVIIAIGLVALNYIYKAEKGRRFAENSQEMTAASEQILQDFNKDQLGTLVKATQAALELKDLSENQNLKLTDPKTTEPIYVLQQILLKIQETTRIPSNFPKLGIQFSPDNKYFITSTLKLENNTAKSLIEVRDLQGKLIFTVHDATFGDFSPNSQLLITNSRQDNEFHLWNLTGRLVSTIRSHELNLIRARFNPNNKSILTVSDKGELILWDLQGNQLKSLESEDNLVHSFSPDGKSLVAGTPNGIIRFFDLANNDITEIKTSNTEIINIKFSHDGQYIVTGSADGIARIWDSNGNLIHALKHNNEPIHTVSFSPDTRFILTSNIRSSSSLYYRDSGFDSPSQESIIWSLSGEKIMELPNPGILQYTVTPQFISQDQIIYPHDSQSVAVININQNTKTILPHQDIRIANTSINDNYLATISSRGSVNIWNLSSSKILNLKNRLVEKKNLKKDSLDFFVFNPNGEFITHFRTTFEQLSKNETPKIKSLFDGSGKSITGAYLSSTMPLTHSFGGADITDKHSHTIFGRKESYKIAKATEKLIQVFTASGQLLFEFPHRNPSSTGPGAIRFDQTGTKIITYKNQKINIYSLKGDLINEFSVQEPEQPWSDNSLLDNNFRVIYGDQDYLLLKTIDYESDGKFKSYSIKVYNTSGQLLNKVISSEKSSENIISFTISPRGKTLFTSHLGGIGRIWNLEDGTLSSITTDFEFTNSQFHPSGNFLLTSQNKLDINTQSLLQQSKVWTLSGNLVAEFERGARFSQNGQYVMLLSSDGILQNVPFGDLDQLILQACNHLDSYLTLNPELHINLSNRCKSL